MMTGVRRATTPVPAMKPSRVPGPVLQAYEPVADEGLEPVEGDDGEAGRLHVTYAQTHSTG